MGDIPSTPAEPNLLPAQARKAAERKGEPLPKDAFDSNCITPGTTFMHRLSKHIRFFIRKKIETDPLWQVRPPHSCAPPLPPLQGAPPCARLLVAKPPRHEP